MTFDSAIGDDSNMYSSLCSISNMRNGAVERTCVLHFVVVAGYRHGQLTFDGQKRLTLPEVNLERCLTSRIMRVFSDSC